jgi:hypothetical protein
VRVIRAIGLTLLLFVAVCAPASALAAILRLTGVDMTMDRMRLTNVSLGELMSGGPVRSIGPPDMVPSDPAPAAVLEQ